MKRWVHAKKDTPCGACPAVVRQGRPLCELSGPGWAKARCEFCAGEKAPQALDDGPTTASMLGPQFAARLETIRAIGLDWKHAQAGEEGR